MRRAIPNKLKALLQKEISSKCPFCMNEDVDHFEIHHIDENNENNNFDNLIMLCPLCHSKITKGDISRSKVIEIKNMIKNKGSNSQMEHQLVNINGKIENAIIGNGNTVNIVRTNKKVREKYPAGCIGADILKANYVGYLVSRYNEFKEYEVGKENMRYGVFLSKIKKEFKIGNTRTIYHLPNERFQELTEKIQLRIDGTKLGKINKGKGIKQNYIQFAEYIEGNRPTTVST